VQSVASTIGALGRRSAAFQLDATERGNVERIVGLAADALGGHIDILVNNVGGLVANKTLDEMDDAYWHEVMEVNLSSVFFCTRAALKYMGSGGRIVSISSLAALNGGRGSVAYAIAKAGVMGWSSRRSGGLMFFRREEASGFGRLQRDSDARGTSA
jgi:3-oxoacyl-[acyl-carrier protein] reductase